jgi:proteasome lid subunit RPN8/RPN11
MQYKAAPIQPQMVFDKTSYQDLETQIDELDAEFKVREIEVSFNKEAYFFGQVTSSQDIYQFLRERILKGIEVQEHFIAIYLNQANKIIGYYHHSTGTINATMVDTEIVAAEALKTLAKSVIISHNHPSGNLQPSEADRQLTRRIKEALKLFDVHLIDHIIVTRDGYYSFAERSESSLKGTGSKPNPMEQKLREEILKQLKKVTQGNSPNLFAMMQTPQGYEQVEQLVITKVLHEQLVPAAVIPLLETEFDMI